MSEMSREEAIKILKAIRVYDCYPKSAGEETKEAIEMAIKALKEETICPILSDDEVKQPCIKSPCGFERLHGEWKKKPRYEDAEYPDEQPDLECPFCGYSIGWWDLGCYCAKCGARLIGSAVDNDARVEGDLK